MQRTQTEGQETPFKHKRKHFYCENGQTLAQAAQRGWGVFMLGDTQNPAEHTTEQVALAYPALNRGLD